MILKLALVGIGLAVLVAVLLFWRRARSGSLSGVLPYRELVREMSGNLKAGQNEGPLSEAEIRETLSTLPKAGRAGAQEIQSRLRSTDRTVIRVAAIEMLASLTPLPAEDYWTLNLLAELANHPVPNESAQFIISHFKRMSADREMLGPALVLIGNGEALADAEEGEEGRLLVSYSIPSRRRS